MSLPSFIISISGDHNNSTLLLGSESGTIKSDTIHADNTGSSGAPNFKFNFDDINNKIMSVESEVNNNLNKLKSLEGLIGKELGVDSTEIKYITSGVSSNAKAISGTSAALAANKQLITRNTNVISTNKSKLSSIESNVNTLESGLSINSNNIRVLKQELESLKGNASSLGSNTILSSTGSIFKLPDSTTSTGSSSMNDQITALNNKLAALEQIVSTLEDSLQNFIKPVVKLEPETFFLQVYSNFDPLLTLYANTVLTDSSVNPIANPVDAKKPFRNDLFSSSSEIKDVSYVNNFTDICFTQFGNYTQTVTVTDIFGNETVVVRPIIVGDFTGPVIKDSSSGVQFSGKLFDGADTKVFSLYSVLPAFGGKEVQYMPELNTKSVSGEDLYDFKRTGKYTPVELLNGDLVFNKEGLYKVNYSATDVCGNVTNATRNIYVYGTKGNTEGIGTLTDFDFSLKTANITKIGAAAPEVGKSIVIGGLKYTVVKIDKKEAVSGVPGKRNGSETYYEVVLDNGIIASTVETDKSVTAFDPSYDQLNVFDKFYIKPSPLFFPLEASGGAVYKDSSAGDVIITDVSTGIYYNNFTDVSYIDLIKTATDVSSIEYWTKQALYGNNGGLQYDVPGYLLKNYAIPIGAYDGEKNYNLLIAPMKGALDIVDNSALVPDASSATQALAVIESTYNSVAAGTGTLFVTNISGGVSALATAGSTTVDASGTKSLVSTFLVASLTKAADDVGLTDYNLLTVDYLKTFLTATYTALTGSGILFYKYRVVSKYDSSVKKDYTRLVVLLDNSKPVLSYDGSSDLVFNYNDVKHLNLGDISAVREIKAFDKGQGDISNLVVITVNDNKYLTVDDISLNVYNAVYNLTYDVSDSYNNPAVPVTKTVKIKDTEGPDLALKTVTFEGIKPVSDEPNTAAKPQLLDPSNVSYIDPIRSYATLLESSSSKGYAEQLQINTQQFATRAAQGNYSDSRFELSQLTVSVSGESSVIRNKPGNYFVDITITDPDGNTGKGRRYITVKPDTEGPVITLVDKELKKYYDVFTYDYKEQGASAIDTVEGEKPVQITYYQGDISTNPYATKITESMMTNEYTGKGKQGFYSVKYFSKDNLDNSSSVVRQIYIFADESSPSITLDPSLIFIQPGEFDSSAAFLASKYYDFKTQVNGKQKYDFIKVFDSQNPPILLNLSTTYVIPSGLPGAGTQDLCFNIFMDASDADIKEVIQVTDQDGNSGFAERRIRITDNAPPVITISGDPYPEPIVLNIADVSNLDLLSAIRTKYDVSAVDTGANLRGLGDQVTVEMINNITIAPSYAENGPWTRTVLLQSVDPCNNLVSQLERRVIVEPKIVTVPSDYSRLGLVTGYSFDGAEMNVMQQTLYGTTPSTRPQLSIVYVNGIELELDGSGNAPWQREALGAQVYKLKTPINNTKAMLTKNNLLYAKL